jgi:hypothetical protein
MSRKPTTHELEALIAALKAENEKLAQRVLHLEEQLRLERLHRYAPKSEKLKERIFNEAEQAAAESRDDDDVEAVAVPDTGLPEAPKPAPKTPAASRCLTICRANASNMIWVRIKRTVRAAIIGCIGWARPSPSSCTSR